MAGGAGEEADAVRVEGLVDGGSPRLGAREGDAGGLVDVLRTLGGLVGSEASDERFLWAGRVGEGAKC